MTFEPDAGDHNLKLLQNENKSFIDSHICQKLAGINPQNNHKSMDIVTLYLPSPTTIQVLLDMQLLHSLRPKMDGSGCNAQFRESGSKKQ